MPNSRPQVATEELVRIAAELAPIFGATIKDDDPQRLVSPINVHVHAARGYYEHTGKVQFVWRGDTRSLTDPRGTKLASHVSATSRIASMATTVRRLLPDAEQAWRAEQQRHAKAQVCHSRIAAVKARLLPCLQGVRDVIDDRDSLHWGGHGDTRGFITVNTADTADRVRLSLPLLTVEQAATIVRMLYPAEHPAGSGDAL